MEGRPLHQEAIIYIQVFKRADDIMVILPAEAGEKVFEVEDEVTLVNPRIKAIGYKIGERGFTNYLLFAR